MNIFKRIVKWNEERQIPKEYIKEKEVAHISEEVTEILRANTIEDNVDGFADIIVYATGAIMKMGYNPDEIMDEVLKHIESRKGSYNHSINKWVKKKSKVYQPNFNRCISI